MTTKATSKTSNKRPASRSTKAKAIQRPTQPKKPTPANVPANALPAAVANRPAAEHGGARRRAGRPRKKTPVDPHIERAADARDAREAILDRYHEDPAARPRAALHKDELLNLTSDQLRALLSHAPSDALGLTNADLDRYKRIIEIQAMRRKERVEAGQLVDADDVLAKWTAYLRTVAQAIDALPVRIAERAVSLAWVSPEVVDRLCGTLHGMGVAPEAIDFVRQELAVPSDLALRIQAVTADVVHDAREGLAGEHETE